MTKTYRAEIEMPDGVVLRAAIEVPEDASYADQDECTEIVQVGVMKLQGTYLNNREPALPF